MIKYKFGNSKNEKYAFSGSLYATNVITNNKTQKNGNVCSAHEINAEIARKEVDAIHL